MRPIFFSGVGAPEGFERDKARGIAARSRQARNQSAADRVNDPRKHEGYGAGDLLHWSRRCATICEYDIRLEGDQFNGVRTNAVYIAPAPAVIDP